MSVLGDAMVDAGSALQDGSSDAAAQPAMTSPCNIERTWREERADGSWSERTYWYASGEVSGLPDNIEASACGRLSFGDVVAPPCPAGSTCTGDNPPSLPDLDCADARVTWDADRWLAWCGNRQRRGTADGEEYSGGWRFAEVRVVARP